MILKAKQKAEELVGRCRLFKTSPINNEVAIGETVEQRAKIRALNIVEKILSSENDSVLLNMNGATMKEFYGQVKKEIEKL